MNPVPGGYNTDEQSSWNEGMNDMANNMVLAGPLNKALRGEIEATRMKIGAALDVHYRTVAEMKAAIENIEVLEGENLLYDQVYFLTGNFGDDETIDRYRIAMEMVEAAEYMRGDAHRKGAANGALRVRRLLRDTVASAPVAVLPEIDWLLLREQKLVLLAVIDHFRKGGVVHDGPETRAAVAEALEGLLHLIDGVQDAADAVGLVPAEGWLSDDSDDDAALSCDRCGKQVPEGEGWYTGDGDERICGKCAETAGGAV